MASRWQESLKSALFLGGSFAFAFLAGEMVHELGHWLAHRLLGSQASIHLDPFGASCITGVGALPLKQMVWTAAAGPALNLAGGTLSALLFWNRGRASALSLTLWGPVAMVQEGVNLSLGLLSPGSDARWLVEGGAPGWLLVILGLALISLACGLISRLLSSRALLPVRAWGGRFLLTFLGLGFLMILRGAASSFRSPPASLENLAPLALAALLAMIIASWSAYFERESRTSAPGPVKLTWQESWLAAGMGLGLAVLQIALP